MAAVGPSGPDGSTPPRSPSGVLPAVACYGIWGLLPLFFKLIENVGALEVVAHRVIWSLLLILLILAFGSGIRSFLDVLRDRRLMLPLAASSLLIAINWLVYVWAVHDHHVLAASLGYFLNPLVSVLLGFLFLHERLRPLQLVAVGFAAIGVAVLATAALDTLWISLALAFSFGLYGLVRKVTPVAPMRGLGAETVLLFPVALAYLLWLLSSGAMVFGTDWTTTLLLILSSAITTVPLVLFAMAAQRLSLAALGVMQYIAPTLQFLCGAVLFGEALNSAQLFAFGVIWLGLALFTADSIRALRAGRAAIA